MAAKTTKSKTIVPAEGTYLCQLTGIEQTADPLEVRLIFKIVDDKDYKKFYVFHSESRTYTAIGASNIHHACNKATKLFTGEWTGIARMKPSKTFYKYVPIKQFGELIRKAL